MIDRQTWINFCLNRDEQKRAYADGRRAVKIATGNTANACAATASARLKNAGLLAKIYLPTSGLKAALSGWTPITEPADVLPGDLVFTTDDNGNGMPDHVVTVIGRPDENLCVLVHDNLYGGIEYTRNLTRGVSPNKTPMDIAYRLPDFHLDAGERRRALDGFSALYTIIKSLDPETAALLNKLRRRPIFGDIVVEK